LSESLSFVLGLENVLGRSHQPAGVWSEALALIREYSGAAAGFVTALLPGNPDQYLVTAQNPVADQRLDKDLWPVKSGLAGWVMQNQKPLVLERARLGSERSYVFYPDEPFKNLPGFIGLPLFHAGRLRGAVLLVGEQAFSLSRFSLENLELAADRLGAHLEMELLIERINELSRLDPQVGLPHRSYFTRRLSGLTRKLKGRQVLGLLVLQIANLEDIIVDRGPEAAQEVLRTAARRLLSAAAPDHELGHLSFGAIGVAVPGATESDVRAVTDELTARFSKRKYETSAGIVELSIRSAFGLYPGQARRAEELVRLCLTKINT
jgi:GGDEF domain-containing protein